MEANLKDCQRYFIAESGSGSNCRIVLLAEEAGSLKPSSLDMTMSLSRTSVILSCPSRSAFFRFVFSVEKV